MTNNEKPQVKTFYRIFSPSLNCYSKGRQYSGTNLVSHEFANIERNGKIFYSLQQAVRFLYNKLHTESIARYYLDIRIIEYSYIPSSKFDYQDLVDIISKDTQNKYSSMRYSVESIITKYNEQIKEIRIEDKKNSLSLRDKERLLKIKEITGPSKESDKSDLPVT